MMRLIEVGELIQTLDDYGLLTDEILAAIEESPIIEPDKARLLTVEDFDGSADVDRRGNLACWIEHRGDHTRDGWGVTNRAFLAGGCKAARCWTKRPEEGQMAGMAWEDGA